MNSTIEIMICYAHEDETLMRELDFQLKFLEQQGHFTIWHDSMISAGADWKQEMSHHLNSAPIILLLISANFLSSEYSSMEIQRAMERYHAGEAQVVPIILRPILWKNSHLGQLKALPKDGIPVTSSTWHNHDEAFMNVAEGVLQIVEELQKSIIAGQKQNISSQTSGKSKEEQSPMNQATTGKVFLCHNTKDKPEVKKIGLALKQEGIEPWLDEWALRPGTPWQRALEAEIATIESVAIFIGKDGIGPWQNMEMDAALREFVRRGCPVIPVLLADAPDKPQLPLFLGNMTWVDFRKDEPDPMKQLIWGIMNKKPDADNSNNKSSLPSGASSASTFETPKANKLSFAKKAELANILLTCLCIRNRDSRETVLSELNDQIPGIANAVSRRADNQADVMEIVSTCIARPGAIQELVNIVAYFEGGTSTNTHNLKAFVLNNGL